LSVIGPRVAETNASFSMPLSESSNLEIIHA
jgi:hypothetical protein